MSDLLIVTRGRRHKLQDTLIQKFFVMRKQQLGEQRQRYQWQAVYRNYILCRKYTNKGAVLFDIYDKMRYTGLQKSKVL